MSDKRKPESFENIFEEFFDSFTVNRLKSRKPRAEFRCYVHLTPAESAAGVVDKEVKYQRLDLCPACQGSGAEPGSPEPTICPQCTGAGELRTETASFIGKMVKSMPCPRCNSTGKLIKIPCQPCTGFGMTVQAVSTTVSIPPGTASGAQFPAGDTGDAMDRNGRRGSVIVVVQTTPDAARPKPLTLGEWFKSLIGWK